ncbi:MAG: tripartite tricarboxylate transporter TctB family protein [Clostridia bacterium]|nr:tripartite tricarboxylate transporter TctB family protein [Clostridia bacterium]
MKKTNVAAGLIGLAISGYVLVTASKFPENHSPTDPGAKFFPMIIAGFTAVLSLILIVASLLGKMKEEGAALSLTPGMKRGFIAIVLFLLYCLLFNKLGFILDTVWLLFAGMYLMENRRWVQMAIVSIVVPVIVYFIFAKLLYVMLPDGLLSFMF